MGQEGSPLFLHRLEAELAKLRRECERSGERTFTMADVIRLYTGGYYRSEHLPGRLSLNENLGEFVARHATELRIERTGRRARVQDDSGEWSSATEWTFVDSS